VLAKHTKHTKHLSLVDILSVGVDRMQRNFEPMRRQVEAWRTSQLSDEAAKLIIYRAFIEGELEVPKHLARVVHNHYFDPQHEEFAPRTMWGLSNAFTSAFKELEAIPQFRATARREHFLRAFARCEHAAKRASAGGKCEPQTYFPPDFSLSTKLGNFGALP